MPKIQKKIYQLKGKLSLLEKKEEILIIADFDDTLFAREEQLEKEILLRENRGAKGNIVMKEKLGFDYMIKNYYSGKKGPNGIINKLKPGIDLILTAGIAEYQPMKIKAVGIENINTIVTPSAEDKIEALVKYIIDTLKHIPTKIEVYEDRPQYFEKYKNNLEELLGTKIDIFFVEMDGNRGYKKIEKL